MDIEYIFFISDEELVAYVHEVSPVKKKRTNENVTYFNFKLQCEEEVYQGVSFKQDLKEPMTEAAASKSPIKITGHRKRANFRNNSIQDVEMGRNAKVKLLKDENCNFKYQEVDLPVADQTTIEAIQENGYDRQVVSVTVYIEISGCHETSIKSSVKKDCYANDATGIITLAMWGDNIPKVPVSGTYLVTNACVRVLHNETILSTSVDSNIVKLNNVEIEPKQPKYEIYHEYKFPIRDFLISNRNQTCKKCNSESQITAGNNFFKCLSKACGAVTRGSNLEISRVIKITTMDDVEITIFQAQLNQYCFKMSIDVSDEDALMTCFLKDESTVMIVCARNNVCISFQ